VFPTNAGGGQDRRAASPAPEQELTLTQLYHIVARRWVVALTIFALTIGAAWTLYAVKTPIYEASATIRVERAKEAVPGMRPVAGLTSLNGLTTEIQLLQSRSIAGEVAKQTGYALRVESPERPRSSLFSSVDVLPGALAGQYTLEPRANRSLLLRGPSGAVDSGAVGAWLKADGIRLRPTAAAAQEKPVTMRLLDEQRAVDAVRKVLKVTQPVRNAEVLKLTVREADPKLAAKLSDATADVFAQSQTRRRQSGGRTTIAFIRSQLDSLDEQLGEAEITLRNWRAAEKVVVPSAEAGNAVALRAQYEQRVAESRIMLDNMQAVLSNSASARANEDEAVQRGYRSVLSAPSMQGNAAASAILSTLLGLEAKRAELRLRRTEEDPDVKVLDKTIADYERQGQLFVRSSLNALRSEIAGNERALGNMGARLERFPGQELELTILQRNAEVLATLQTNLRARLKEVEISNASNEANVEIIDRAVIPEYPIAPVMTSYLTAGLLLGTILAVLGAVGQDRMDRTVHSREDAEQATGAALVGLIPTIKNDDAKVESGKKRRRLEPAPTEGDSLSALVVPGRSLVKGSARGVIAIHAPRHVAAEAYRILRTNLRFAPADQPRQVLTVSSPSPGDGKSTTSLNFAATLAATGMRVLLVDADMRRGTLHKRLELSRTPGLSGVLTGKHTHEEAVRAVQLGEETVLDLIACGEVPPNPAELLGGAPMERLLAWARVNYEMVIIDTPPVNIFADGLLLAAASDAALLVGRAGKSFKNELAMAAGQLRSLNVPIAGVLLNDFDVKRDSRYGSTNYYDRAYYGYYASYAEADTGESAE
jgi:tyrosine-protein kinase Etk/Wzc